MRSSFTFAPRRSRNNALSGRFSAKNPYLIKKMDKEGTFMFITLVVKERGKNQQ